MGMDHETRELFGNIIGLLEIVKKDIKVIKQDILVLSRQGVPVLMNREVEESRQSSKVLEVKKGYCSMMSDQLKMSRLK